MLTRSILFNKLYQLLSERTLVVKCVADTIGPTTVGNGITHVTIPSTLRWEEFINLLKRMYIPLELEAL